MLTWRMTEDFGLNSKIRILLEDSDQKNVHGLPLCFIEPMIEQL